MNVSIIVTNNKFMDKKINQLILNFIKQDDLNNLKSIMQINNIDVDTEIEKIPLLYHAIKSKSFSCIAYFFEENANINKRIVLFNKTHTALSSLLWWPLHDPPSTQDEYNKHLYYAKKIIDASDIKSKENALITLLISLNINEVKEFPIDYSNNNLWDIFIQLMGKQTLTGYLREIGLHKKSSEYLLKYCFSELNYPSSNIEELFEEILFSNSPVNNKVMDFALSNGMDINNANKYKTTPLNQSINKLCATKAMQLLDFGANPGLKDKAGKNAFDELNLCGDFFKDKILLKINETEQKLLNKSLINIKQNKSIKRI